MGKAITQVSVSSWLFHLKAGTEEMWLLLTDTSEAVLGEMRAGLSQLLSRFAFQAPKRHFRVDWLKTSLILRFLETSFSLSLLLILHPFFPLFHSSLTDSSHTDTMCWTQRNRYTTSSIKSVWLLKLLRTFGGRASNATYKGHNPWGIKNKLFCSPLAISPTCHWSRQIIFRVWQRFSEKGAGPLGSA